jgi:uncharacterized protein (DUF952 family)
VAQHHDSTASREAGITYHLVPEPVWERSRPAAYYVPESYEQDGFIHCTNGTDQLVAVANLFYMNDPRSFRVLVLDVSSIESEVRYDDPDRVFPHIYGPLNTNAVRGELHVTRAGDGTFLSIGPD